MLFGIKKRVVILFLRFTFPFKDLQARVSHTLARRAAVVPGRPPPPQQGLDKVVLSSSGGTGVRHQKPKMAWPGSFA